MRKQTKKWTTKDGRKIRICDMLDEHLENTINRLIREAEVRRYEAIRFYMSSPGPNGDMAQMLFDQEQEAVFDSCVEDFLPPIYTNLIREKERRESCPGAN